MRDMADEGMDLFAMPAAADWSGNDRSTVDKSTADKSTLGAARPFEPLAQRMRPRNFEEFIGQQEAVGAGRFLRQMIERDQISSMNTIVRF